MFLCSHTQKSLQANPDYQPSCYYRSLEQNPNLLSVLCGPASKCLAEQWLQGILKSLLHPALVQGSVPGTGHAKIDRCL